MITQVRLQRQIPFWSLVVQAIAMPIYFPANDLGKILAQD